MRTIGGRIGLALLAFGLVTLLTVGGALWIVLRDLHRDAALGSLAELTLPYASQARQRFPPGLLRQTAGGERPRADALRIYRESEAGRAATREFRAFVSQAQGEIEQAGISVLLVADGGTVLRDPATGASRMMGSAPVLTAVPVPGTVQTGTTEVTGLGDVLYAAIPIREPLRDREVPTLMLVREDDSAQLATADLVRAVGVAALVLLVIGIPLALGLSRSVSAPLRRLAAASDDVARGVVPEPLPTSGPSEVADASAAFNAMAAEVDATRQAQQQLLADVRHDLRTPLTVIAGFSEALRDGTATGPAAERAAAAISDEAGRLERMLADLDHLTVPGADLPTLRFEALDGVALAQATVERFAGEAEVRGQRITYREAAGPASSIPLLGDRDALDRMLGNIVANALAFAPSPGGQVWLEVDAVADPVAPKSGPPGPPAPPLGLAVRIAVRDDGPGISPAALGHVFDRFYRADPARATRGSGLGLAIVRDLAEASGGFAFAENAAEGGARVGVVLPAAPRTAPSAAPTGPT